jgi:hypothetical protein
MDDGTRNRDSAIAALADRRYEDAGDEYTRAAWHHLASPREGQSPFEADEHGWVGRGLEYLTAATLAYRVAGEDTRASRRAVEGVAVARDLENALEHPAQRACLREFVADFRAVGDVGDAAGAYDDAVAAYEAADEAIDDVQTLSTRPLFEAAAAGVKQLARGLENGEIAVPWEDLHGADPARPGDFLAARARFKRQRVPSLVARTVEAGHLAAPRGTTEYNNETYRCPDCGSNDVNWVGDSTLCMRCSTPVRG